MEAFNLREPASSGYLNRIIKIIFSIFGIAVLTFAAGDPADAKSGYTTDFNSYYGTGGTDRGTTMGSCITCHVNPDGKGGLNSYGNHYKAYGHNFAAIEALDSDGDGFANIDEIIADTWPGNVNSRPAPSTAPPLADAGPDRNVQEGAQVVLDGSNSFDADGDIASYLWEQTAGTPVNLSNAAAVQPTFTAPDVAAGGESLTFRLTVTDSEGQQGTDTCIVNISAVNHPPVANAGPDRTVNEGVTVTLDGSNSSDADNDIATYQWEQTTGTPVTLSNPAAVQPTFTAPDIGTGGESLTFRLTVTDSAGLQDTDTSIVNISWVNIAPTANAGPDKTVDEGQAVTLSGLGSSDPDDGIVAFAWQQLTGTPVTLSNPSAVQPVFTAPDVGTGGAALTFQLTVTDSGGLKGTDTCIVNISWVDLPPTADAGPDQTVEVGVTVTLDGSNSTDQDDGIGSYLWTQTGGPPVTLSDPSADRPTFLAPDVGAGGASLAFALTVTDQFGLQNSDTCVVNVSFDNTPPTADAGGDRLVNEGLAVTLDGSNSSDTDGSIAAYLWTQTGGTPVTLSDPSAVRPVFAAPDVGPAGQALTFQLQVTDDGGLQDTDTCIVNVSWVNLPPTANAGPDQTVREGDTVSLDGSNSDDLDDGIASYHWTQTGGPPVTLSNPSTVIPLFTAPLVGAGGASLTFQLTVTDSDGLQDTDTCIVNISWVNLPPTADAGADQTVNQGVTVALDGSGSTDPEGSVAAYLWTQTAGSAVTLSDPSAARPTFTAPGVGPGGGSLTFKLTVTDSGGLQASDTINVNVTWQNQPPVADAGPDQSALEGTTVTLDASASTDQDDGIISYAWVQTGGGPAVTLSDTTAVQPTLVAPAVDQNGAVLVFELTVKDGGGLQSSRTVSINVTDNGISGFPPEAITMLSAQGHPIAVLEGGGGSITRISPMNPSNLPAAERMPEDLIFGLLDMQVKADTPGATVTVTIFLPQPAPAGYKWYKFNPRNNVWTDYTAIIDTGGAQGALFNDARDQVTLTLVDGGIGDDDGIRNAVIEDPSGLGAGITGAGSIGSNSFGAGGGCFIDASGAGRRPLTRRFPALLGLAAALAALFSTRAMIRLLKPKCPGRTIEPPLKESQRQGQPLGKTRD